MNQLIDWFARNNVAANLLMALILGAGFWSMTSRIPLEVFPSFERDIINVAFNYKGATPAEVEQAVIIRAEEAVADLEGIKSVSSTAYEGAGRLRIEINKGLVPRDILDDVKNEIERISTFPNEVEKPNYSISEFRREVITVSVSGDLPELELRKLGERVRDDLANLEAVTFTELNGTRNYEMAIEISPKKLKQFKLSFAQIAEAIRRHSADTPAGSIKTRGGEILLRTTGLANSVEDFSNIVIVSRADGSEVTVGDLAVIKDGFEEDPRSTYFNSKPAAIIEVYRSGQQNAITVAEAVKNYVEEERANLPSSVSLDYWRDRSRVVKLRLNTLLKSAWQGGLLVLICLTLFLRLSVALWVCLGIPISFMGAMILMPALGVSFNVLSLFAFILVLGIVVDDAIITGENIYSQLKKGKERISAAVHGAQEVAVPVTFGLLTTIMAFIPLAYLGGRRGPLFAQLTLIIIPVLVFSWIESKLILPAHLSHIRVNRGKKLNAWQRFQRKFSDGLERAVERVYQPVLKVALERRYVTIAIFVSISMIIGSFFLSGRYGFTFFPRIESETARATVQMQAGTPVEKTNEHIQSMSKAATILQEKYTDPETQNSVIKNILSSVGWRSIGHNPQSGGSAEIGQVSLELMPPEERTLDIGTRKLVQEWRELIGSIPGAKDLNYRAEIGRGGEPIDVELLGNNFLQMRDAALKIRQQLTQYPGLFAIKDTLEDGKTEVQLSIKPEARLLGLSASELGEQVKHAFYGAEVQRIQRNRDDVRVVLRYPKEARSSLASLNQLLIRTKAGDNIPISHVADLKISQAASSIQRDNRMRVINISADANKQEVDLPNISADLADFLATLMQSYPDIRYQFSGELEEQKESFDSLKLGIIFVLFAIYALLAIPLRSYAQPLVVMSVIPFCLIGALIGHMIVGINLSLMSILGMLALAGVAVNDSLVLMSWVNKQRALGMTPSDAVRKAGAARFRAILLTSLTTFFGLTPLLLEKSTQAQFLIPMAVSLGFGILYATLLSLILVPSFYLMQEDIKRFFRWVYLDTTPQ